MVLLDPEPLGCKVTDQVGSVYLRSLFFSFKVQEYYWWEVESLACV